MSIQHAKQRIIKDISNNDQRIQVTAYIKRKLDNEQILLNDKTGEINVIISDINNFDFKDNDLINVIGDLEVNKNGEKIIRADIIQDMNKLNFDYYQKIYQIKKELE